MSNSNLCFGHKRPVPAFNFAYAIFLAAVIFLSACGGSSNRASLPDGGTLEFSSPSSTMILATGSVVASVSRIGGSSGAVTVDYATNDGTAIAGKDYTASSGTLRWENGDSAAKIVSIPVRTLYNGVRTFAISLTSATGGVSLGALTNFNVTIDNRQVAPSTYREFEFSKWKLTLPVDQYGGTGGTGGIQYPAVSVSPAQLTAGYFGPYFFADLKGNVIFTAPSTGAVSTPGFGSDHTRSELRELYSGPGADSHSNWNSTIGGRLTATCTVQSVSARSDEVTIGQIHGQDYVFMLLIYRPAKQDIAIVVYDKNKSNSTTTRTSLVSNVKLGSSISYSIDYRGNAITTTVNGNTYVSTIDNSWVGAPVYFKLGAYHAAPNTGTPGYDASQVSFQSFTTNH